jgi:hypothetical protein
MGVLLRPLSTVSELIQIRMYKLTRNKILHDVFGVDRLFRSYRTRNKILHEVFFGVDRLFALTESGKK